MVLAVRNSVVFRWDLNEPGESVQHRSGWSEFHMDGPHTEKAHDAKSEYKLQTVLQITDCIVL